MKTKVIIEEGKSRIVLTPENDFEKTVLENAESRNDTFTTNITSDHGYGQRNNQKLIIEIIKDKK